jgi:hypothetical protein
MSSSILTVTISSGVSVLGMYVGIDPLYKMQTTFFKELVDTRARGQSDFLEAAAVARELFHSPQSGIFYSSLT